MSTVAGADVAGEMGVPQQSVCSFRMTQSELELQVLSESHRFPPAFMHARYASDAPTIPASALPCVGLLEPHAARATRATTIERCTSPI
jgi:hypothetical protein